MLLLLHSYILSCLYNVLKYIFVALETVSGEKKSNYEAKRTPSIINILQFLLWQHARDWQCKEFDLKIKEISVHFMYFGFSMFTYFSLKEDNNDLTTLSGFI